MGQTPLWWQTGVIYQVYPRSFYDSNGDGVGDLPGITSKLDYLSWLGVDAFWLSPIFPSPRADFGYDISNYTDVHPLFGTLEDLDVLLQQAHRRNLKVILDYVPTVRCGDVSGDHNPLGLEAGAAPQPFFGERVAHGRSLRAGSHQG